MPGGRLARWGLLAVVLLAALVRVGYVVAAKRNDQPAGDAIFYSLEATELVHGHGFVEPFKSTPAADHPPLIALSLAPAAWLFDDSVYAMRFTNVVLGTLTVLGIALLARRLVGHTAGIAAGAIAALYPGLWINDGLLMGETLAALATVGVLLGALELRRRGSWGLALLCGLLVGLAGLVRAELLLLWVVAVVPAVFARGTRRRLRLGRLALSSSSIPTVNRQQSPLWSPVRVHTHAHSNYLTCIDCSSLTSSGRHRGNRLQLGHRAAILPESGGGTVSSAATWNA